MKVFPAWVNERKESYVGGGGHTRGAAIEVEGDDDDAEDKEQPKDKDKYKGKDKAKDEPKARTWCLAMVLTVMRHLERKPFWF